MINHKLILITLSFFILSQANAKHYVQISIGNTQEEREKSTFTNEGTRSSSTYKALYGYRINKYISAEVIYSDLGSYTEPTIIFSGITRSGRVFTSSSKTSINFALNANYSFKSRIKLFTKLGYGRVSASGQLKAVTTSGIFITKISDSAFSPFFGIGINYKISNHSSISLGLDYQDNKIPNNDLSYLQIKNYRTTYFGYRHEF